MEAKQLIDSNPNIVILDVRTIEEFNAGHIKDAINIPVQELLERLGELNKNDDILVYCRTGVRSAQASQILADDGFTKIYNMDGGISEWISEGFSIIPPTSPPPPPPIPPTPTSKETTQIVINEFEQNPDGNDSGNEWVELYNPSTINVNISGWTLSTTHGTTVTITIPIGTIISANGYWTYTHSKQWLDNEDESIVLRDLDENEVDRTLTGSDGKDDNYSWGRSPNGKDINSNKDWKFQVSTQGEANP